MLRRGFLKSFAALAVGVSKVGVIASMFVPQRFVLTHQYHIHCKTVMDDSPRHGMVVEITVEDIMFDRPMKIYHSVRGEGDV